jgi:toxin ParE1/3/4
MPINKYQVRLLRIAEEDFGEIISFITADNPTAATALADKIEKNLELLSENPKIGRVPREEELKNPGYRYLIVQNYLIFYSIEKKTVLVHRILHGAKNYKSVL